ncbi:MAG: hypothetical protein Q9M40_02395 [Sulfurimonas sp.]|nr:hypothetical protein [Sulfurimonas sp.]
MSASLFKVDKNFVSDQVIVVYENKAYDYSSYFTPTQSYDSLNDAVEQRQKINQEMMQ